MREMHVAMALIEQDNAYLLQKRVGPAAIGAAGLIGCFGGKIKDKEKPVAAIVREISEETTLLPDESEFIFFDQIEAVSDWQGQPVDIRADVFCLDVDEGIEVGAKEGDLIRMSFEEATSRLGELTPATREVFEKLAESMDLD